MSYEQALERRIVELGQEISELQAKLDDAAKGYAILNEAYMALADKIAQYREFFAAHEEVEAGIIDFDLHGEAVERLKQARRQIYEFDVS